MSRQTVAVLYVTSWQTSGREVVVPSLATAGVSRVLGWVTPSSSSSSSSLHLQVEMSDLPTCPTSLLTLVSWGLGGPCILQLYMLPELAGGYPGPPAPAGPGLSALEPETGWCQEPPPGSEVTPWLVATVWE